MSTQPSWPVRVLKGFGMFWWDFLVGDTPELFLAAVLTIVIIDLVSRVGHHNAAAVWLLPILAVLALSVSVLRAVSKGKRK
ncbi:MAG: hypothetical protein HKL87_02690 [Acidimicrobiaceae bacterium]|nr:hypothetical protein [Acidimicrobiaceae bacterium]